MKTVTVEIKKLTLKISILVTIWSLSVFALWVIAKSAMAMM